MGAGDVVVRVATGRRRCPCARSAPCHTCPSLSGEPAPELAEAYDVPADWPCRTGVCHRCESGLVDGAVDSDPEPLDDAAAGQALLRCPRLRGQVTIGR